ncbi:hypothetical protein Dform_01836 [Dehalogenimonas formicexedens]|uniref:MBG domain-containing protein n=1 Tax=Dehalogenimonas formicexedens TaxID=1839801 RepID=A0A1P8F9N7_9CHLR|nr:MBG domain-containing protein [Dehalogenimonas formicexedens]APV45155.1 hypothetical protein Dform_01836 [Dehalogenimonas formicexedens]
MEAPSAVGSCTVVATVDDVNYQGGAAGTMVIFAQLPPNFGGRGVCTSVRRSLGSTWPPLRPGWKRQGDYPGLFKADDGECVLTFESGSVVRNAGAAVYAVSAMT